MHCRGCFSLYLLGVLLALAQSGASLSGVVLDLGGDAVANAPVEARNAVTKTVYKTSSSATGAYSFGPLPPGAYEVTVDAPGFSKFVQKDVAAPGKFDVHLLDYQLNTLGDGREVRIGLLLPHETPSGPAPRTPQGKPDFSGLWHPLRVTDPGQPEPLPWAAKLI